MALNCASAKVCFIRTLLYYRVHILTWKLTGTLIFKNCTMFSEHVMEGKVFFCPVRCCNLWRILLIKSVLLLCYYIQDGWCHPFEERIWFWAWKIYIYLYFLPSHLCITLLSCCRNVIYGKVTGEANSAWKATESKTETEKNRPWTQNGFLGRGRELEGGLLKTRIITW